MSARTGLTAAAIAAVVLLLVGWTVGWPIGGDDSPSGTDAGGREPLKGTDPPPELRGQDDGDKADGSDPDPKDGISAPKRADQIQVIGPGPGESGGRARVVVIDAGGTELAEVDAEVGGSAVAIDGLPWGPELVCFAQSPLGVGSAVMVPGGTTTVTLQRSRLCELTCRLWGDAPLVSAKVVRVKRPDEYVVPHTIGTTDDRGQLQFPVSSKIEQIFVLHPAHGVRFATIAAGTDDVASKVVFFRAEPRTIDVQARVDGKPVATHVTWRTLGVSVTTVEDGPVQIVADPASGRTLHVSSPGHEEVSVELNASTERIDVTLEPMMGSEVRVLDASGAPVPFADLYLVRSSPKRYHGRAFRRADREGSATLPIESRADTLVVRARGFHTVVLDVGPEGPPREIRLDWQQQPLSIRGASHLGGWARLAVVREDGRQRWVSAARVEDGHGSLHGAPRGPKQASFVVDGQGVVAQWLVSDETETTIPNIESVRHVDIVLSDAPKDAMARARIQGRSGLLHLRSGEPTRVWLPAEERSALQMVWPPLDLEVPLEGTIVSVSLADARVLAWAPRVLDTVGEPVSGYDVLVKDVESNLSFRGTYASPSPILLAPGRRCHVEVSARGHHPTHIRDVSAETLRDRAEVVLAKLTDLMVRVSPDSRDAVTVYVMETSATGRVESRPYARKALAWTLSPKKSYVAWATSKTRASKLQHIRPDQRELTLQLEDGPSVELTVGSALWDKPVMAYLEYKSVPLFLNLEGDWHAGVLRERAATRIDRRKGIVTFSGLPPGNVLLHVKAGGNTFEIPLTVQGTGTIRASVP